MKKKTAKKEYKYFLFVSECCHRCGASEGYVYTAKDKNLRDWTGTADYQFYTKRELIKFCEEKEIDIDI